MELFFLDGRQFRSAEQFCNPDPIPDGPETPDTLFSPYSQDEALAIQADPVIGPVAAALLLTPSDPDCVNNLLADPDRTLLGVDQLEALKQALLASDATFKIIVERRAVLASLRHALRPLGRLCRRAAGAAGLHRHEPGSGPTLMLTTDFHTNLAIRAPELTEVIVGPIGQTTFGGTVRGTWPSWAAPEPAAGLPAACSTTSSTWATAAPARCLGSAHDAFSYGVVEVFEDSNGPHLRFTARGNPDYLAGGNDPNDVVDLFSFEMP